MSVTTASDAHRVASGDFDEISPKRLPHYLHRARHLTQPRTLLAMADDLKRLVIPGRASVHQLDAFDFLDKLDRLRSRLDLPQLKKGQQLSFNYDSGKDSGKGL